MIEFKISDFMTPRRVLFWRWKLWKIQYESRDGQRDLQWEFLSGLLDHCFAKVPYYKKLFTSLGLKRSDFKSLEDLPRIPILKKDILLDFHRDIKSQDFTRYRPREIHTSGTTGTPLRVYWDLASNALELTCMWRHFSWSGYRLGEPFLDIRSVLLDESEGYRWNWKCRGLEISSDMIDASNIESYAALLRRFRVKLWRGHPHSIDFFCRLLSEKGIEDVRPKYVFTSSEALLENQRHFIQTWTGVPVCDNYGLKEHNVMICQCPVGGYHIAPEYGIVEIIKDDGTSAGPGEEGRIVATGLHNKAFPLLRYDTGDYAIYTEKYCPCGKTLPLVKRITGRIDDRILTKEGRWVSGLHFAFFFLRGIRMAQLVQEHSDSLDVYLVTTKDYQEEISTHLTHELKNKLGKSMKINVHIVQEIPYSSPGKFKFVINKLGDGLGD
jgi:phenylacetate-CoA ligase